MVASIGTVVRDEDMPDGKDMWLTEFRLDEPVALTSFSLGPMRSTKTWRR